MDLEARTAESRSVGADIVWDVATQIYSAYQRAKSALEDGARASTPYNADLCYSIAITHTREIPDQEKRRELYLQAITAPRSGGQTGQTFEQIAQEDDYYAVYLTLSRQRDALFNAGELRQAIQQEAVVACLRPSYWEIHYFERRIEGMQQYAAIHQPEEVVTQIRAMGEQVLRVIHDPTIEQNSHEFFEAEKTLGQMLRTYQSPFARYTLERDSIIS